MMFRTLIKPAELLSHLEASNWRVVDCRFDLANPDVGERAWQASHVPGAVYAHLEKDLSGPVTSTSGRHPLPVREKLAARLGQLGIGDGNQVVVYDASGGAMAARLWWLLRWLGHEAVAVLDGGWQAWRREDHPIETGTRAPHPVALTARVSGVQVVSSEDVARAVEGSADFRLVDARAAERFRGDVEPIDSVPGHVPGALNRPFADNLDEQGGFLAPPILRERFAAIAGDRPDRVVHYCGSGVTACHNLLAMEHAGLPGSRLYAGSWSEWIRDASHPVAQGG